jgi:hypothetical protein
VVGLTLIVDLVLGGLGQMDSVKRLLKGRARCVDSVGLCVKACSLSSCSPSLGIGEPGIRLQKMEAMVTIRENRTQRNW